MPSLLQPSTPRVKRDQLYVITTVAKRTKPTNLIRRFDEPGVLVLIGGINCPVIDPKLQREIVVQEPGNRVKRVKG